MIYFFTFQILTYLLNFKISKMSIDCLSMLLNNYNKSTFRVVFGAGVCSLSLRNLVLHQGGNIKIGIFRFYGYNSRNEQYVYDYAKQS